MSKDLLNDLSSLASATPPPPEKNHMTDNVQHVIGEFLMHFPDDHMQKLFQIVKKVATTNACILVVGENGTGKKTLGKIIHEMSKKPGEVSTLNVAEIEKENQVTLLLDAINDNAGSTVIIENIDYLTESAQIQFNAILKNQVTLPKPTRIIATTEADLALAIRNGNFFKELYYRLNVIRLEIPALRQRKKDILPLVYLFLRQKPEGHLFRLHPLAEQALMKHHWSGNIQELRNIIDRASMLATSSEIKAENLEIDLGAKEDNHWVEQLPIGLTMKDVETQFILRTLQHHQGNRTHSAKTLGISLRTLRNKINEFEAEGICVAEPTKGRALP